MYNKKQIEYSKKYNKKQNKFYVYIYLDPRKSGDYKFGDYKFKFEPFYVGKGNGFRDKVHLNESKLNKSNDFKTNKIKRILANNLVPIIIRVSKNMFECDAFILECKLIKLIGRADLKLGPLTNLTDGGDGASGYKFNESQLEFKRVKIKQFSLTGEFIKEWKSIDTIKSEFGDSPISDVCNLKRFSLNNFIWRYSDDTINIENLRDYIKNYNTKVFEIRSLNGKTNNKKIIEYDINFKTMKEWESLSEAKNFYGVSITAISNAIKHQTLSVNKLWFYLDNFNDLLLKNLIEKYNLKLNKKELIIDTTYKSSKGKMVKQFKNGKLIKIWCSITDVNKHLGIQIGNINKVCNNIRKSAGGYEWTW